MKKLMYALCATTALAFATPALSQQVTATDKTSGTPLQETIHMSTSNTADNVPTVYGSTTQPNWNSQNVTFTGGNMAGDASGFTAGNTTSNLEAVNITDGGGFASLADGGTSGTPSLWSLIINPDELFTDMKFAVQLSGGGNFDIYYLLSGSSTWSNLDTNNTVLNFSQSNQGNNNYLIDVSGGIFDAIELVANDPPNTNGSLFEVKQISINPSAVPEPETWAMMLFGFGGIAIVMRRRRRTPLRLAQLA